MSIECLANDYIIKEQNDMYYVYNELYEESFKAILTSSLLGMLIPEAEDYYIPIGIEIKKTQEKVIIEKNLDVIGKCDFRYFIARHQYKKWKKTYCIIKNIIFTLSLLLNMFSILLFWNTNFNWLLGLCVVCTLFLTFGAIIKLELHNKKRRKYEMIDITF